MQRSALWATTLGDCSEYPVEFRFCDSSGSWLEICRRSSVPSTNRVVLVRRGVDALTAIVTRYLVFFGTRGRECSQSRLVSAIFPRPFTSL